MGVRTARPFVFQKINRVLTMRCGSMVKLLTDSYSVKKTKLRGWDFSAFPVTLFCIYHLETKEPIAVWDEETRHWHSVHTGERVVRFDHIDPYECQSEVENGS